MHIVILTTGYPTIYSSMHGVFFKDQAEALATKGNKVGMIVLNAISIKSVLKTKKMHFGTTQIEENGVKTRQHVFLNIPRLYTYRIHKSLGKGMRMFADYVKVNGLPEIIHIHSFHLGPMANEIKKKYNVPFVITEHSTGFQDSEIPKVMWKYAKQTFENSDLNISVSTQSATLMSKLFKVKFQVVPNVVNTSIFVIDEKSNVRNTDFTFFTAGNLIHQKNHQLLLEAFADLSKIYANVKLRIAGAGALESNLKLLSIKLGIEEKVIFLGLLPRSEILKEMQKMDTFVLSSRSETFGVVLIESLSCGKPVISTKCGGPESIIVGSDLGVLCEQTRSDLYSAMSHVYATATSFDSEKIRAHALSNYSPDAIASKLMILYEETLSTFKLKN